MLSAIHPRLKIVLSAAALSCALFLAANYIVTSGRLMFLINSNTDDVAVHYSSASGNILTQFRFTDLNVRGQDFHTRWQINLKQAVVSVSLWRLLFRTFQTSQLIGSGLTFKLEFKEHPVAGPDPEDSYKTNWRIRIADIQLDHISEVKIGDFTLPGDQDMKIQSGGFYFWPGYELQIDPSRLLANQPTLKIDFKFRLDRVLFRERPGYTFFHELSGDLSASGASDDLAFLNYYFRALPWLSFTGSGATLKASLQFDKGIVRPQSQVNLAINRLSIRMGRYHASGSGTLRINPSQLDLHLAHYRLQPIPAQGDTLDLMIRTDKVDLADPLIYANEMQIVAKGLSAELLGSAIKSDLRLEATVKNISSTRETMNLQKLSLALTRVQINGKRGQGENQLKDWWGTVSVSNAALQSGPQSFFAGTGHFTSRDGKPLLLFLRNTDTLPLNLAGLIPMRELQANAVFRVDRRASQLTNFHLQSSSLQAAGHLEMRNEGSFGKIKIEHPIHSFEIHFLGKKTKVKW